MIGKSLKRQPEPVPILLPQGQHGYGTDRSGRLFTVVVLGVVKGVVGVILGLLLDCFPAKNRDFEKEFL